MLVNDKTAEGSTGALRSESTRAAPFARPDISPGVIAMTSTTVVQGLTGRADIAILFWLVSETLRCKEGTPLSFLRKHMPGADVNDPRIQQRSLDERNGTVALTFDFRSRTE